MLTLYDYILSDDCYKVRILLSMLQLKFKSEKVDVHPGNENASAAFLALNPLGQIPVLLDEGFVLREPHAILTYLAMKYDPERRWLPLDPESGGRVAAWLMFAATQLAAVSRARDHLLFGWEPELDVQACRQQARAALEILDDQLAEGEILGTRWLVGEHPTIADIAVFPALALAGEAGLPFEPFPAIWRWIDRVKRLPNFVVMPGVLPLLPGVAA